MTANIQLWCFPFAGAGFYAYRELLSHLPSHIIPEFLELPGRGKRMDRPLLNSFDEILDDTYNELIKKQKPGQPFAFFGHSMGAQLAYSIAHRLQAEGRELPVHILLSGRGAPTIVRMKRRFDLPENLFREELKKMGGVPDDILNDNDFYRFFEPILRADFRAIESYKHTPVQPLDIPFTVMLGDAEETTIEEAKQWNEETTAAFDFWLYPGGHFFIFEHAKEICSVMGNTFR
jgi:surfactin synthase thioesterase subunit